MPKPFTRDNAKEMALRSIEARKRNREQRAQLEAGLAEELGANKPITKAIFRVFRKRPKLWEEVVEAQILKAAQGNTKAFQAIADRTDGPVRNESGGQGPVMVLALDWSGDLRKDEDPTKRHDPELPICCERPPSAARSDAEASPSGDAGVEEGAATQARERGSVAVK